MSALRPRWVAAMEAASIATAALLLGVLVWRLAQTFVAVRDFGLLLAAAAAGLLAADFASGAAHWFCDTFFEEDTPLIGRRLIAPFREHHRDPLAMTRHGFLEMNGNNCLALVPLLALAVLLWPAAPATPSGRFAAFFVACFFLSTVATNRFHGWAHDPAPPAAVRWLQERGLILAPKRHGRHHAAPYAQAFCVTNGWLNPLLDGLGFFHAAERALVTLGLPRTKKT
jgi:ubiquitin-conjugating enzyme E2 variant